MTSIPTYTVDTQDLVSQYATLSSIYASATEALLTVSKKYETVSLLRQLDMLSVSEEYLNNEYIYATATESSVRASAASVIAEATAYFQDYQDDLSVYGMTPSYGGNMALAIVMEFAGYVGRTVSAKDPVLVDPFLDQIISLTLAPAFIMGGIYYMLAKLCSIFGEGHSKLKPMSYAKIFIICDLVSIIIQAVGGGMAASAAANYENADTGTHIMVAGLAFQVASMTLFLYFWFDMCYSIYKVYRTSENPDDEFNDEFKDIRQRPMFNTFPVAITLSTLFVYVRCIYRVAELSEGWRGHLITEEIYFLILDSLMMCLAIVIMLIYFPGFVFGKDSHIPVKGFRLSRKKKEETPQPDGDKLLTDNNEQSATDKDSV
ncbi:Putative integral membrane transporter or flippase [Komagataella phaffii CBS 7435]|uniref:Sphingoid long-chain base transporter RSB1 n=1 Tax=Komagataella phaffii (strain ATCC 76273 / CBS 7435 / CECT 11047 / NRRL Y-11430 / Wegner 21-1) TaxID=981350 RepID=F2QZ16_KOMPC|nr:Putative integral membrane transporter or flippase [Komagataella phaffii CBS 7435]CCA40644.1 Putative integral membrane transporter or flippase [Komagataella phaffii CBS 7435]